MEKNMKAVRKIIEIDEERCDGCGQCVIACAEAAIEIVDGKAKLIKDSYCDGLGACLGECPQGALRIIQREAVEFDPEEVEHYLEEKRKDEDDRKSEEPFKCPSSQMLRFETSCEAANRPVTQQPAASALSHWPVQIRLVPPNAPFLKGADLLVAADCTPVAYANFHCDFLQGKTLLLGCPKFDDVPQYIKKFAEIFRSAEIRSITVLTMEVPCCSALPVIVKKGMAEAGKNIPIEEVVVGVQGGVVGRRKLAA
jgi:NAD-dependent dihydropyrimidine dehydrogenase PreA subunit